MKRSLCGCSILLALGPWSLGALVANTVIGWTQQSPNPHPTARGYHAMAYIGDDKALLFGGLGSIKHDDTWVFDLSEGNWTQISPPVSPSYRAYSKLAYMGEDQALLSHGWWFKDDTWMFDLSEGTWTELFPSSKPSGRHWFAMAANIGGHHALMFGGCNEHPNILTDETWIYDISANNWIQQNPSSKPSPRREVVMADIGGDHILLFGGRDNDEEPTTYYDDTWIWAFDHPAPPRAIHDLTATLVDSAIHLGWTAIVEDTLGHPSMVEHYTIYRKASPVFSPGPDDSIGSTADTLYIDPTPALNNTSINHYYVVKAVDSQGLKSEDSNCVGEYDLALTSKAATD